ncbi:MAG: hypothetical protein AB7N76_21770 [Planctomycetota bacterium]
MTRPKLSTCVIPCLLLALAGCRGPAGGEGGARPRPRVELPGTGLLVLRNASERVVFHLRLEHEGERDPGGDRLAEGDVVKSGQERRIELPVGRYRVHLEFGDGTDWKSAFLDVRAERPIECVVPAEKPAPREGRITVKNETPWAIAQVRFSATSEMSFGDDRLGGALLPAGASRTWPVAPGSYQLQVEFQDGSLRESMASKVKPGEETTFKVTK